MSILDDEYTQTVDYDESGLHVSPRLRNHWTTTSKWAVFLSVLGFIVVAILALVTVAIGPTLHTYLSMFGARNAMLELLEPVLQYITVIMIPVLAVLVFVYIYHIRFAYDLKKALNYNDQPAFETAWRNLRNYFRIFGIFTIVLVVIYLVVMILMLGVSSSPGTEIPTEF